MTTPSVPATGSVIANRYRLVELLGVGGMGSVWRAEHLTLRSMVAIKLINADGVLTESQLSRFMREAQAAAALRSPHVVQILDHGVEDGVPYIAMELLEGEMLSQRIARLGRLSAADTARIVTHIARAVARAHQAGIVHRDLKPDNVFLITNDEEEIAKVLDFGIAKTPTVALDPNASSTRTGSIVGTPFYMGPEQLRGAKNIDHRADLWAIGVIAYECMVGKKPFVAESLGDLVLVVCTNARPVPSAQAPVPDGFDAWFARAVALEPEARFQDARQMARELRALAGMSDAPQPTPMSDSDTRMAAAHTGPQLKTSHSLARTHEAPRSSSTRWAAALVGVVAIAAGGIWLARSRSSDSGAPVHAGPAASSEDLALTATPPSPPPERTIAPLEPSLAPAAAESAAAAHTDAGTRSPPSKTAPKPAAAPPPIKPPPPSKPDKPAAPSATAKGELGVGF